VALLATTLWQFDAVEERPSTSSDPPKQHQNDNDDQDGADHADATVTVAVTVATKSATEATELSMAETNCAKWRRESVPVGLREKGFEARCYFCFLVLI
jgi:hypothetical protein